MIIALTGPQGAGKDTVADCLVSQGFSKIAFADAVRAEVSAAFACPIEIMLDRNTKEIPRSSLALSQCNDNDFVQTMLRNQGGTDPEALMQAPRSPRWILQQWGTEYRRNTCAQDYWLQRLIAAIDEAPRRDIVITDMRFLDEAMFCSCNLHADIWMITRPGHDYKPGHASEKPLPEYFIDRWLRNRSTIQTLNHETITTLNHTKQSMGVAA